MSAGAAIRREADATCDMNLKRTILVSLGFVNVSLGIFGLVLPLLPTTPLLLLAAYLFMRSSDR